MPCEVQQRKAVLHGHAGQRMSGMRKKDFQPEWGPGTQRRFCGDACRIQWWTDYHPSLEEKPLWCECCGQALRADQKKYCSCACYLRAMEETHRQQVCAWCGEDFSVYAGEERQYCCQNCTSAAQTAPKNFRRIHHTEPESWTRCRGPIPLIWPFDYFLYLADQFFWT